MRKSNYSKFLILWSGDLISQIGGGLTSFGLGVYIFNKTGSAAWMALVILLGFLPTLLLSVPAGVFADMYDRRTLMMIGDGFSAIGMIYILVEMMKGDIAIWQICLGVSISSVFSSLLEPSYRATVTDILSEEEYTKANGLASLSSSARYLVSPVIAGFLLGAYDIKLLLIIDICTFFVTFSTTAFVKKYIKSDKKKKNDSFLSEPMILSFTDSKALGISETVCALGMLVTALITGIVGIRKHHSVVLSVSLILAGAFMVGFSIIENVTLICIFGFLFFAMLPLANSTLDYLARINMPNELQGRVWGFIGFISQLGYIPAYALSGILADFVGKTQGIGVGRGSAVIIGASGIMLMVSCTSLLFSKRIRNLEKASEFIVNKKDLKEKLFGNFK